MDLVFGKLFHFWLPSQMFTTTELRWLQMKKNKFVPKFGMLSQTSSLQLSTKDFFAHWVAFFGYFGETGWLPHRLELLAIELENSETGAVHLATM